MQLARVIGTATATAKHASMVGAKLLVVQPLDATGESDGTPILAIDELGSGLGDRVLLTSDGRGVREMVGASNSPVRWAVMGVVDENQTQTTKPNRSPKT